MNYKGHAVIDNHPTSATSAEKGTPLQPGQRVAQYPGTCRKCQSEFGAGTIIARDDNPGWFHVECPPMSNEAKQLSRVTPEQVGIGVDNIPAGLPNGVWTVEGPRGHKTYRISTVLAPGADQAPEYSPASQGDLSFRKKYKGKRVLELMVGPDNTSNYKGLAWYDAKIGKLWKFGQTNEVLVNVFAKLVERGEELPGYTVHFARHCYICNRLLTTPESIERGIGPTCAGRDS